jgi:flagellar capping protein FliD
VLRAVLVVLAAVVPTLLLGAPAAQAGSESLGTYHCGAWHNSTRYCAKLSVFDQKFSPDYTRTFYNSFAGKTITVQCTTSKQTTWNFSVSATVKAEAGVIFAKAEASATAGVEHSVTTTDTASATFRLGPHKYAYCKRGAYVYSLKGTVRKTYCSGPHCTQTYIAFTGKAPSRDAFFIGPGRG